ncbi:hypothetical protein [Myxococcus xanthus]|uniref:hypothetical protein n=1 Tax=Myxococcus xanthus TaxID=34 RepID=UPI00191D1C57
MALYLPDAHREQREHESKIAPEAKLVRKGKGNEAKPSYCLHGLMENRHGLLVDLCLLEAQAVPSTTWPSTCRTKPLCLPKTRSLRPGCAGVHI